MILICAMMKTSGCGDGYQARQINRPGEGNVSDRVANLFRLALHDDFTVTNRGQHFGLAAHRIVVIFRIRISRFAGRPSAMP
jgi:hypothetical protein